SQKPQIVDAGLHECQIVRTFGMQVRGERVRRQDGGRATFERVQHFIEAAIGEDVRVQVDDTIITLGEEMSEYRRLYGGIQFHDVVAKAEGAAFRQVQIIEEDMSVKLGKGFASHILPRRIHNGDYARKIRVMAGKGRCKRSRIMQIIPGRNREKRILHTWPEFLCFLVETLP